MKYHKTTERMKKFILADTLSLSKKVNLEYAYGWNRYIMTYVGIWPENRSLSQASSYIAIVPVLTILCFVCVPQLANLPFVWGDLDLLIDNLSMGNIIAMIAMLKTIIFWFNGGRKYINFHTTEILVSFFTNITNVIFQC